MSQAPLNPFDLMPPEMRARWNDLVANLSSVIEEMGKAADISPGMTAEAAVVAAVTVATYQLFGSMPPAEIEALLTNAVARAMASAERALERQAQERKETSH